MKPYVSLLILIAVGFLFSPATAPAQETTNTAGVTYVIPVNGLIEAGLLYSIDRGLQRAKRANADTIIFHMDTPGGALTAMQEIRIVTINLFIFIVETSQLL